MGHNHSERQFHLYAIAAIDEQFEQFGPQEEEGIACRCEGEWRAGTLPAYQRERMVLGGDLNLVGTRIPLEELADDMDADGSDLMPAPARVLGDRTFYTWRNADTPFPPGRLDWLVYSDATLRTANSFVLDTAKLSDAVLKRAGLRRDDSLCSDHLPVVVDVISTP